jgi:uncharacterized protein (TIGR03435 family)
MEALAPERHGRTMTGRVHLRQQSAVIATLLVACLALATSAHGQVKPAAANTITPNPPAFEVVSVRRAKPDCNFTTSGGTQGHYTGRCVTAWMLILNAYEVRSFWDHPAGLPAWADEDRFDVEAKTDDDTVAAMQKLPVQEQEQQTMKMLQSLLADRFKLRVHYESKVQPTYELVLAKGGLKLKPLPANQKPGWGRSVRGELEMHGRSIAEFAHFLSQMNLVGRTVVDKTGVAGNYDIDLKWTPDDQQGTPDAGPTLITALEEQLGLKLVPAKGPVDALVIDHVERPTEN